jgi:regulatory protein
VAQAKAAGAAWLARREHGQAELLRKLRAKGFDAACAGAAVEALAQAGLQSNARFGESLIRARAAKGYGPLRIRLELRQQGLEEGGLEDYDWDVVLARTHEKKFGPAAPATPAEYAARARFLSQRGFAVEAIHKLLRQLCQDTNY